MLDMLMQQVRDAVTHHTNEQNAQGGPFDPSGLLNTIGSIFGQHQQNYGNQPAGMDPYGGVQDESGRFGNVRPASQDPYGDPADQAQGNFRNVRPASEDPYGDPADQQGGQFRNVKPASQDPYGDPADQGR